MKILKKVIPVVLLVLLIAGCGKQADTPADLMNSMNMNATSNSEDFSLGKYNNISQATLQELEQAKIATAKYHDINKAFADGYADINVFIHHMGFHFLKSAILDSTFEVDKPELLVYTPNPGNGNMQLVALEYAVPLSLSQNAPEGFTGDSDVWQVNDQFQLWTLHAWVWYFNPDGVFSPMNSRVP